MYICIAGEHNIGSYASYFKKIIKLPQIKKPGKTFKIIRVCWLQESKGLENLIYNQKNIWAI